MKIVTQEQQIKQWGDEAHELGRDVGRSAASWCIDGNTHRPWIVETLRMIDEGDPAYVLSGALKDYVGELIGDLGASLAADLIGAALSEVDWDRLAEHALSEVLEES